MIAASSIGKRYVAATVCVIVEQSKWLVVGHGWMSIVVVSLEGTTILYANDVDQVFSGPRRGCGM